MLGIHDLMIQQKFSYDPNTGVVRRKYTGKIVGTKDKDGYLVVQVGRKQYRVHNIAWFLHYKMWPTKRLDHRNRIRDDNKITNLREATHLQNMQNRKDSGVAGVSWHKAAKKWRVNFKSVDYGTYDTFCKAYKVRRAFWNANAS